jgi:Mg2+ and Co2+ transporter CorA
MNDTILKMVEDNRDRATSIDRTLGEHNEAINGLKDDVSEVKQDVKDMRKENTQQHNANMATNQANHNKLMMLIITTLVSVVLIALEKLFG